VNLKSGNILFACFLILTGSLRGASTERTLAERVVAHYANRSLPSWEAEGKIEAPRVVLAKLYEGRQVEAVNDYLRAQRPWAGAGSDWKFGFVGFKGDYDFTLATLVPVLFLFGDDPDILFPETREHLLHVLLVERDVETGWDLTGGEPRLTAPGSFGLVPETENHILMTEGSRYLKNQWLREKEGRTVNTFNNLENGLEDWLLGYLNTILEFDWNEFNSIPYEGYAIQGMLNLAAFASSEAVRSRAREILDDLAWRYAVGSLGFRRYPPFNRQGNRAADRTFGDDRLTALMRMWAGDPLGQVPGAAPASAHHMLPAAVVDYRPPAGALGALVAERWPFFIRFGRGSTGSPEVYSGGRGYLLSAGGSSRSLENTARQTVLFLDDGAASLNDSFYLEGREGRGSWNHTGVHENFACTSGAVRIPSRYKAEASSANWQVFRPYPAEGLRIAVHNGDGIGLLVLFPGFEGSCRELVAALKENNPAPESLRDRFQFPGGSKLTYRVNAGRNTWVIESVDGAPVERSFNNWPRPRPALKDAGKAFSVDGILQGEDTDVEASVADGRSSPNLSFLEVPPECSAVAIESWGLEADGSEFSLSHRLTGEDPELFRGTVEITEFRY
jgi:hypothetical protein